MSAAIRTCLAGVLVALVLAASGCGGDDGTSTTTAAEMGATGVTGSTAAGSGEVPLDGPPDPELTVAEVAELLPLPAAVSDDPAFKETLDILIASAHKYFSESLEIIDVPYHTPEFIAYDGASGDEGPDCGGGERAGVENAAYCNGPGTGEWGIIAWDETGLLEPFFRELGDGAVAFVVGHEYGHLVQDRLGILQEFPLTIEKELQADCLTGDYFGGFGDAGVEYSRADIQSIIDGITVVGDAPGTPWQATHAHGTAEERQDAFFQGFEKGPEHCFEAFAPGFSG